MAWICWFATVVTSAHCTMKHTIGARGKARYTLFCGNPKVARVTLRHSTQKAFPHALKRITSACTDCLRLIQMTLLDVPSLTEFCWYLSDTRHKTWRPRANKWFERRYFSKQGCYSNTVSLSKDIVHTFQESSGKLVTFNTIKEARDMQRWGDSGTMFFAGAFPVTWTQLWASQRKRNRGLDNTSFEGNCKGHKRIWRERAGNIRTRSTRSSDAKHGGKWNFEEGRTLLRWAEEVG